MIRMKGATDDHSNGPGAAESGHGLRRLRPACHPGDVFQQRVAALAAKARWCIRGLCGHWVVTHYKEIHQVLTDPETFSSHPNNLVTPVDFGKFIHSNSTHRSTRLTARCCSRCSARNA